MDLQNPDPVEDRWKGICRLAALAALILFVYSAVTIFILVWLGGSPATVQECFDLLQKKRIVALLRLDLLTILIMPLFGLLYAGLFIALRRECPGLATIGTVSALMGATLVLASASIFSLAYLSDQYAATDNGARKEMLLAAGEAVISNDTWHGMGAKMGGSMLQLAGVLISVAMLRSTVFGKLTAYSGLVTHGLDLLHILVGVFWPWAGALLMFVAGPLYFLWLPLVAMRLNQLGRFGSASTDVIPEAN